MRLVVGAGKDDGVDVFGHECAFGTYDGVGLCETKGGQSDENGSRHPVSGKECRDVKTGRR